MIGLSRRAFACFSIPEPSVLRRRAAASAAGLLAACSAAALVALAAGVPVLSPSWLPLVAVMAPLVAREASVTIADASAARD